MRTINITTVHNVNITYKAAPLGSRILAWGIDSALLLFTGIFIMVLLLITSELNFDKINFNQPSTLLPLFFIALPLMLYNLLCEIGMKGQTIGKNIMKIRVISLDGSPLSIGQCLIRWTMRIIDLHISSGLPAILTIAFKESGQRIGDIAAKTAVIEDLPAKAPVTAGSTFKPSVLETPCLTSTESSTIQKIITFVSNGGNKTVAEDYAKQIRDIIVDRYSLQERSAEFGDKSIDFIETVLRDHTGLSAD